jgi:hypothetical protein
MLSLVLLLHLMMIPIGYDELCKQYKGKDDIWPHKVPIETKIQCCKNFQDGTVFEQPPCCAVCGCEHRNATIWEYYVSGNGPEPSYGLDLLQVTDQNILQHSHEFVFGNQAIDLLMLSASGIQVDSNSCDASIQVCDQCHGALSAKPHPKLPKFALKNKLYHGCLPDEFKDIT